MERAADASGFDDGDFGGLHEEGGCFAEFAGVVGWVGGWGWEVVRGLDVDVFEIGEAFDK